MLIFIQDYTRYILHPIVHYMFVSFTILVLHVTVIAIAKHSGTFPAMCSGLTCLTCQFSYFYFALWIVFFKWIDVFVFDFFLKKMHSREKLKN